MKILKVEKHLRILKCCKEISQYVDVDNTINDLIVEAKNVIKNYNKEKLKAIDISLIEKGKWKSTIKKTIISEYVHKAQNKYKYKEDILCQICTLKSNNNEILTLENCKPKCKELYYEIINYNSKITDNRQKIHSEFMNAVDNTKINDDLIQKYTLLSREIKDKNRLNDLEKSIKESIKIEMLKTFEEQNKKLILKYN